MSFREQLGLMRREYCRDIAQMAKSQAELETKINQRTPTLDRVPVLNYN